MNLSGPDEQDVLGYVSKLGTGDSDVRGKRLIASNVDARAYQEQVTGLRDDFQEIAAAQQRRVLSPVATKQMSKQILKRAEENCARSRSCGKIHPAFAFLGFAAAGALVVFLPQMIHLDPTQSLSPTAGSLTVRLRSRATASAIQSVDVRFGEEIAMREPQGVLKLRTECIILLQRGTRLTVDPGFVTRLSEGQCFVLASSDATFLVGAARLTCSQGLFAFQIDEDTASCSVYEGQVRVNDGDMDRTIGTGQSASLVSNEGGVHRSATPIMLPAWVKDALTEQ